MTLKDRIRAFALLGVTLEKIVTCQEKNEPLEHCISNEYHYNAWFTPYFIRQAIQAIARMLQENDLNSWMEKYSEKIEQHQPCKVGVIMAGNIPLVGFHDFLSVLLAGDIFVGKLSSNDQHLLPAIVNILLSIEPRFQEYIFFEDKISGIDKIIATGGEQAHQYFSYYFRKYPSIIRSHCNSVALLNGQESNSELSALADDIMLYFGMGCRSVSKIYVPQGYQFRPLFEQMDKYKDSIGLHNKYLNNLEYQKTLHLMDSIPFLDQGMMVVKEHESLSSPIAVLHYEYYSDTQTCNDKIKQSGDILQCAVCNCIDDPFYHRLGQAQNPRIDDYANHIDTIRFLTES